MSEVVPGMFVWLFDQRFDYLCNVFQRFLWSRTGRSFEPVLGYVMFPDTVDAGNNSGPRLFQQRSPEEVNATFVDFWRQTSASSGNRVPVSAIGFTMDRLQPLPGLALHGSSPDLVHRLSDKVFQLHWLKDSGLPVLPLVRVASVADLGGQVVADISTYGPLFVQPAFSAGGELAAVLSSSLDVESYAARLQVNGLTGKDTKLLITQFLPEAITLSGHALVTRSGRVLTLGVDELLQNRFRFDGFVFPTCQGTGVEDDALELTSRAGYLLASQGYWGYFAVDFLFRPEAYLLITEINVRFAGEAAFLAACMPDNLFSILDDDICPRAEPLIRNQNSRMAVTKIRPLLGRTYAPTTPVASEREFLEGAVDAFRVHFHEEPIHVVRGHFIGLAGRRFGLQESFDTIYSYYLGAREPEFVATS